MSNSVMIGVVMSGCGHQDGTEIHEAVMTLWAIQKHGGEYQCFAPDIPQHHVLNHVTGEEMSEQRNVLTESGRIARGNIRDLKEFDPDEMDAVIFPGGMGAVKNLSTFMFDGPNCKVHEDVEKVVRAMVERKKPVGALCIAPAVMAKILGDVEVTVGQSQELSGVLQQLGAIPRESSHGEIVKDSRYKIVSTACYMLDAQITQIADDADKLVKAVIEMIP